MLLGDVLQNHARFHPERQAIDFGAERLCFGDLNARVNRLANAMALGGVGPGDRVVCILPNCLELVQLYWATAKLGAIAVPLSNLLNAPALCALIDHSEACFVFLSETAAQELDQSGNDCRTLRAAKRIVVGSTTKGYVRYDDFIAHSSCGEPPRPAIGPDAPVMITYSSGTTGDPKGIVLSHRVRALYCLLYSSSWRMTPESTTLHTGSLVFNGAFMTLLPSFYVGGRYILHDKFEPERVLETIEREGVTHMAMIPSQIQALIDCATFDVGSLESIEALISLGSPLHLATKQRLLDLFGERFYEMYGLAEGFMTILDKSQARTKLASVGTPPAFFEMRIIDAVGNDQPPGVIGEIIGRGPILMDGYWRRPDLTEKAIVDGWLHSGDMGFVDEDGYLHISDRKKEMIKSGGVSVYPSDIESTIIRHSSVQEVAVFGIPHPKWGEAPVAAVILRPGQTISPRDLITWVNAAVPAKFQRVVDLVMMTNFPRNAAGKTLKRDLQKAYLARSDSGAELRP